MLTGDEIKRAGNYVEGLRKHVHNQKLPDNRRTRAAGSCWTMAQEYHHAIILLVEQKLFAASFALLRVEFDAYIRGEWLFRCASDSLVDAFLKGKEPPRINCMLEELEMLEEFKEGTLSQFKNKTWKALCAYTHTGGLHVQRWNTQEGIEANYQKDELLELVRISHCFATLAVIGVANLADDNYLANQVLEQYLRFSGQKPV